MQFTNETTAACRRVAVDGVGSVGAVLAGVVLVELVVGGVAAVFPAVVADALEADVLVEPPQAVKAAQAKRTSSAAAIARDTCTVPRRATAWRDDVLVSRMGSPGRRAAPAGGLFAQPPGALSLFLFLLLLLTLLCAGRLTDGLA